MAADTTSAKNRLLIHLCETAVETKILVLDLGSLTDLAALCKLAGAKLGKDDLKRVFLADGTEVQSHSEILDNDNLYFSSGDDFSGANAISTVVDTDADASDEKEDGQTMQPRVLTKLAGGVLDMASSLYGRSSSYVKGKSPYFKVTLERVEDTANKAATYANPLITRFIGVGSWADDKLDNAYNVAEKQRAAFMESQWGQTVKQSLIVPLKHRVMEPSQAFYAVAIDKFNSLKAQAADGKVDVATFLAGLRDTLGTQWNERLVEPAKAVHAAASKNLQTKREELGRVWHDKVVKNFPPTLRDPAEYFYAKAVQSYTTLRDTASDGKVTLVEFIAAMRVMLGSVWSERLMAPAKHLYEKFTTKGSEPVEVPRPAPWNGDADAAAAASSSSPAKAGATGDVKPADDASAAALAGARAELEEKLSLKGADVTVVHYKTQTVAGTNFFLKLKHSDKYSFARVFRSLQGEYSLHSVQANKTAEEEVQYF